LIKEAAIRLKSKPEIFHTHTGKRHDIILNAAKGALKLGEQGFVTDSGEFVTREEAARIAFECGQIKEPKKKLFSEDLIRR
jgi:hypothetical protein